MEARRTFLTPGGREIFFHDPTNLSKGHTMVFGALYHHCVEMVTSPAGSRMMLQSGTTSRGSETMGFAYTLNETTASIENVFADWNPGYDDLEEEIEVPEAVPAVKEDSSSDYSKHVDTFKEFWEMVEKLSV